jgi:hypothetical protein
MMYLTHVEYVPLGNEFSLQRVRSVVRHNGQLFFVPDRTSPLITAELIPVEVGDVTDNPGVRPLRSWRRLGPGDQQLAWPKGWERRRRMDVFVMGGMRRTVLEYVNDVFVEMGEQDFPWRSVPFTNALRLGAQVLTFLGEMGRTLYWARGADYVRWDPNVGGLDTADDYFAWLDRLLLDAFWWEEETGEPTFASIADPLCRCIATTRTIDAAGRRRVLRHHYRDNDAALQAIDADEAAFGDS